MDLLYFVIVKHMFPITNKMQWSIVCNVYTVIHKYTINIYICNVLWIEPYIRSFYSDAHIIRAKMKLS